MRSVYDEEEDLDLEDGERDREITLGSTTLLMIFFGLVLVCALFFGLGYTFGRRSPSETASTATKSNTEALSAAQSGEYKAKPSASSAGGAEQVAKVDTSAEAYSEVDGAKPAKAQVQERILEKEEAVAPVPRVKEVPAEIRSEEAPAPVPAAKPVAAPRPAVVQPAPVPVAQSAVVSQSAAVPSPVVMVQIAAVSNPKDADVLVAALKKHGYAVAVRRSATDSLIHVQVGPFTSRGDAQAMKVKLQGDGYNAILK
jgi:DedD protein